ncbi:hypothetical protein KKC88_01565 [Patescibacteria group bacterium]|nr:hypothetical protein [Patescibacteria group bacterium]MBU1673197.1 hypothetical protein [Patescibacteria group bacterium]MBU1963023.1 hypothetical protein [Patescibacteria group bacterium]
MPSNYWRHPSSQVFAAKAVVTETGQAVARNYDIKSLRSGDIGLHVRIDRGQCESLSPAQQAVAAQLVQDMSEDLREQLGVVSASFEPGTVVRVTIATGSIQRHVLGSVLEDNGQILRLHYFPHHRERSIQPARMTVSFGQAMVEEFLFEGGIERRGIAGLALAQNLCSGGGDDKLLALIKDDDEALKSVALNAVQEESRLRALRFIKDEHWILEMMLANHIDPQRGVEVIKDDDLLTQIVLNMQFNEKVRFTAMSRLTDPEALVALVKAEPRSLLICEAIDRAVDTVAGSSGWTDDHFAAIAANTAVPNDFGRAIAEIQDGDRVAALWQQFAKDHLDSEDREAELLAICEQAIGPAPAKVRDRVIEIAVPFMPEGIDKAHLYEALRERCW